MQNKKKPPEPQQLLIQEQPVTFNWLKKRFQEWKKGKDLKNNEQQAIKSYLQLKKTITTNTEEYHSQVSKAEKIAEEMGIEV